ncbi:MAG TPA: preprotein translocase subunit YajC [Acidimicrobiia bacterium]|nr:preprotein translocase subunit YajC [Acidimicrobiia bacterium]
MNTLAASSGTNVAPLILSALVIGALFFVMIVRPQKRNIARHRELVASLKAGDDIITSGGIYGAIVSIDGDSAQVSVASGVVIKVAVRSIAMKKAVDENPSDGIVNTSVDS